MNGVDTEPVQSCKFFPGAEELTAEEKRWMVDPENSENPFHNFVGQEEVVSKLSRLAFQALGRNDHDASDISVALLGPSGTGKTTVARLFAQLLDLPFVTLNPKALKNTKDVFDEIQRVLTGEGLRMTPQNAPNEFQAPPCVVFIDEVHQLSRDVEQGLLTACEANTATMETPSGRMLDTSNVCWVIATTDRGALFDAFEQRFSKAYLKPYDRWDIALIILANRPKVPPEICKLIAQYCCVTREAIDFATEVIHERNMNGGDWRAAVEQIRKEQRIDEYGMSETRLAVLKALGDRGPISVGKLQGVAKVKVEELEKFTLPPLMEVNEDHDALIQSSSRGYFITEQGLRELEKRGIPHRGSQVLLRQAGHRDNH